MRLFPLRRQSGIFKYGLSVGQQQEILAYAGQRLSAHSAAFQADSSGDKPFVPFNDDHSWIFGTASGSFLSLVNSILSPSVMFCAAVILLAMFGLFFAGLVHFRQLDMAAVLIAGVFAYCLFAFSKAYVFYGAAGCIVPPRLRWSGSRG